MKSKQVIGKTLFAAAMVIGVMSAFTATAHADEWRDHERMMHERHEHERMAQEEWHHRHHRHEHDRPVVVEQPEVVYAPPVVVQAPDTGSSGGFNITIPLYFN